MYSLNAGALSAQNVAKAQAKLAASGLDSSKASGIVALTDKGEIAANAGNLMLDSIVFAANSSTSAGSLNHPAFKALRAALRRSVQRAQDRVKN